MTKKIRGKKVSFLTYYKYKIWKHLQKQIVAKGLSTESAKVDIQESNHILNNKLDNFANTVNSQIADIKNILILKELFPDIIKQMLPEHDFLRTNSLFGNALERSFFQTPQCGHLKEIFSTELSHIIDELYKVTGGITSSQYAQIYADFINKDIDTFASKIKLLNALLAAHDFENDWLKVVKEEIDNDIFNNYGIWFWGRYFNLCLYKEQYSLAEKIFHYYEKNFGMENIKKHLLLSSFAYDLGYKDDIFFKANAIYNALKINENANTYEKLIQNKTVAIIGNGPQQNGKKTGKEIDGHDIVIRFNDYDNTGKYAEDLGTKTDIWVDWIFFPIPLHNKDNLKAIVIATDIYDWATTIPHNPTLWDDLYNFLQNGGKILSYPYLLRKEMLEKIHIPTSGFSMVYWTRKIKADFQKSDCYGFSFTQDKIDPQNNKTWFHFSGALYTLNRMDHSLSKEKEILDTLFNEK